MAIFTFYYIVQDIMVTATIQEEALLWAAGEGKPTGACNTCSSAGQKASLKKGCLWIFKEIV